MALLRRATFLSGRLALQRLWLPLSLYYSYRVIQSDSDEKHLNETPAQAMGMPVSLALLPLFLSACEDLFYAANDAISVR